MIIAITDALFWGKLLVGIGFVGLPSICRVNNLGISSYRSGL